MEGLEYTIAMDNNDLKPIIKAMFEARYLKRIKRSGTSILLGNEVEETIVEHSFYVSLWALVISHLNPKLDTAKLLTMCLTHDLEEVRTGDLHQINRLYLKEDVTRNAFSDMWKGTPLGNHLINIQAERITIQTPESMAANDCDCLAELVTEKEYLDKGNKEAEEWMEFTISRIVTEEGKLIAKQIINSRITEWWEEIKNKIRAKHNIPARIY